MNNEKAQEAHGAQWYTDGAGPSSKSSGRCGWAAVNITTGKVWAGGHNGTNNFAEMLAMLRALELCEDGDTIHSDSAYVVETFRGKFRIGANQDLWTLLLIAKNKRPNTKIAWVKGHSQSEGNKAADRFAGAARDGWSADGESIDG